jgi:hypothetical protein
MSSTLRENKNQFPAHKYTAVLQTIPKDHSQCSVFFEVPQRIPRKNCGEECSEEVNFLEMSLPPLKDPWSIFQKNKRIGFDKNLRFQILEQWYFL